MVFVVGEIAVKIKGKSVAERLTELKKAGGAVIFMVVVDPAPRCSISLIQSRVGIELRETDSHIAISGKPVRELAVQVAQIGVGIGGKAI